MTNLIDKFLPYKVIGEKSKLTKNQTDIKIEKFQRRFTTKNQALNYMVRGIENKKFRRYEKIQNKTYHAKAYLGAINI